MAVGGVIPKLNDLDTLLAVVLGLIVNDLTKLSMTINIGSDLRIANHRPQHSTEKCRSFRCVPTIALVCTSLIATITKKVLLPRALQNNAQSKLRRTYVTTVKFQYRQRSDGVSIDLW